eukprot:GFUD01125743.1.p1 GENE.GFUD01125743.1~~GFUD01125743.1.p1  ORF type:complete len:294 (-),score=92.83 GFUD01125743.1:48-929(-)
MSQSNLLHFLAPNSRLATDVTFQVTPSSSTPPVTIPAHKCFLATASSVFDKMFFESDNSREQGTVIEVKNIEEKVFRMFLNHIYGKEVVLEELADVPSAIGLFQLMEQYDIVELKEQILARIKSQKVEKDNYVTIVNLVGQCEEHSEVKDVLQSMVFRYLQENLGMSLGKLTMFMTEHGGMDGQAMVSVLGMVGKVVGKVSGGKGDSNEVEMQGPPASSQSRREIVMEFLKFSNFPGDKLEKMVDMFINRMEDMVINGMEDKVIKGTEDKPLPYIPPHKRQIESVEIKIKSLL